MMHGPAATRCIILNPILGPETIAGSSRAWRVAARPWCELR
jgi:hypothetical protein